jgi:ribonuclease Z
MGAYDELKLRGLTLRGVAQGGIQTSLRVPELKLMFDVGKSGRGAMRYDRILISHGHQDHAGALFYLLSQRGMMGKGPATVHIPAEIEEPLRAILKAWSDIEGFDLKVDFRAQQPGDRFELGGNLFATALRTVHRVPSLAYVVERESRRLKPEFRTLGGEEIGELKRKGVGITDPVATPLLCVTGDTQMEFFLDHELARKCQVLVHEVTAWDDRRTVEQMRSWGHTHVEELIEHSEKFEGESLVLVHRSMRHSKAEAEKIVRERFPASVRDRIHVFGG